MIYRYGIPVLAGIGLLFGVRTVISGNKSPVPAPPLVEPARPAFSRFVAGVGLVETSTENISIGSPVGSIVEEVLVRIGARVKRGEPLFVLDRRDAQALLVVRSSALELAQAELRDAEEQFALWSHLKDSRAVSKEDFIRRRNAVAIARSRVELAKSEHQAAEIELSRRTIAAPVDGEVLQVKIRPGEFAPAGVSTPLMLLGDTGSLNLRVDIDEHDAWRVQSRTRAVAHLRGNPRLSTALTFLRFEPFVVPKRNLTGDSSERVDTRVLQVVYRLDSRSFPIYVGQVMDVFIEELEGQRDTARNEEGA